MLIFIGCNRYFRITIIQWQNEMSEIDWIILSLIIIFIVATMIWAYRKRHRLFNTAQFTAETCYRYFQTADKQQAIDAKLYQKEEKEEDDSGQKK